MVTNNYKLIFILFFISFGILFLTSNFVDPQASMDSCYYHILTDQLEKGEGFVEPFVWQHLRKYDSVVHPTDYWMPLGTIAYYFARILGGENAEVILNIVLWSVLSVFVFIRTFSISKCWVCSIVSFLIFTFSGRYTFYLLTTDNIAIYAFIGYWFLFFAAKTEANPKLMGFISAIATLTRIEGIIFSCLALVIELLKSRTLRTFLLFTFVFVIVISPWAIRNKLSLNEWWPSNSKALYLREYGDIFNENFPGTFESFCKLGIKAIAMQKLKGLWNSFLNLIAAPAIFILYPLWILGIKKLWKNEGKVFTFYLTVFWFLCGALFTHQGIKGTSMHIGAFFYPHVAIITGLGLFYCKTEKKISAKKLKLIGTFLGLWAITFSFISIYSLTKRYDADNNPYKDLFEKVKIPSNECIISVVPIYVYYLTGVPGVISVMADGPERMVQKYNCNYVLTDERVKIDKPINVDQWNLIASNSLLTLYQRK